MTTKDSVHNIPFQVQQIIDGMLNKKDNVHVRGNYRMRLDSIRSEIDRAIKAYDNELYVNNFSPSNKKRRA